MNLPSAERARVFSDSERIQSTGTSETTTTTDEPGAPAASAAARRVVHRVASALGRRVPNTLMKTNAMIATITKTSTDTAEPSPRFSRFSSWL